MLAERRICLNPMITTAAADLKGLWEELLELLAVHDVTFVWVKGHNGHPYNERCDALATAFADSFE